MWPSFCIVVIGNPEVPFHFILLFYSYLNQLLVCQMQLVYQQKWHHEGVPDSQQQSNGISSLVSARGAMLSDDKLNRKATDLLLFESGTILLYHISPPHNQKFQIPPPPLSFPVNLCYNVGR